MMTFDLTSTGECESLSLRRNLSSVLAFLLIFKLLFIHHSVATYIPRRYAQVAHAAPHNEETPNGR